MSVSARTFQLLYIVRQRAIKDLPTTLPDFVTFIAERRAEAPQTYDRAYISPSAIKDALDRMCSPMENLLIHNNGRFELEFMGSQMADLLDGIDGCSSAFIDGYKEHVVKAVLEQRARLGQPRANQRDIAACAHISLDSARRGLQTLMDNHIVVEYATGRNQTYALANPLANPPTVFPVVAPADPNDIRASLAGISDAPAKVTVIPETLAGLNEEDDLLPGQTEEAPVPLGAVLQDGGPDVEAKTEQEQPTAQDEEAKDEDDPLGVPTVAEVEEGLKSLFEEDVDEEVAKPKSNRYSWSKVPVFMQDEIIIQAKACDMSLADYLVYLIQMASMRFRKALSPADDMRLKALVDKTIFPRYPGGSGSCQVSSNKDESSKG